MEQIELKLGSKVFSLNLPLCTIDAIFHAHFMAKYDVKLERIGTHTIEIVKNEHGTYGEYCDYRVRLSADSNTSHVHLSGDNVPPGLQEVVCEYVDEHCRTEGLWELCDGLLAHLLSSK